jgi:hypothetical protein
LTRGAAIVLLVALLAACQSREPSRWQEGYEDGCLYARGSSREQCEARATEIEGLDADYRAGWTEGYEACRVGPEGC